MFKKEAQKAKKIQKKSKRYFVLKQQKRAGEMAKQERKRENWIFHSFSARGV